MTPEATLDVSTTTRDYAFRVVDASTEGKVDTSGVEYLTLIPEILIILFSLAIAISWLLKFKER